MSRRLALLAIAICGLAACHDRDPFYLSTLDTAPPIEVGGALLLPDRTWDRITVIEEKDGGVARNTIPYEGDTTVPRATPDGKRVLFLDRAAGMLTAIEPANGKRTDYPLTSDFTSSALSSDGRTVLLYHGAGASSSTVMVNTAEVSLIDLDAAPAKDTNPFTTTIVGLSKVPSGATVGPEVPLADGKHRLIWLTAESTVAVLDSGPGGKVRTSVIPLTPPDSASQLWPTQNTATVAGGILDLYLIATGSSDVVHLRIDLNATALETSLDQILSGAAPANIHVYQGKSGTRIVTVNSGSGDLAWLDPKTGSGTYVTLDAAATTILPFWSKAGEPMAFLWNAGGYWPFFLVADLENIPKKKGKAVDKVVVGRNFNGVLPCDQSRLFLLLHGQAEGGATVYDTVTEGLTTFSGTGKILDFRTALDGAGVFILGQDGAAYRLSRLGFKDLHATSLTVKLSGMPALSNLGKAGAALLGGTTAGRWVVAFPTGEMEVEKSTYLEGFSLEGVL